jgi:hypothetical protein
MGVSQAKNVSDINALLKPIERPIFVLRKTGHRMHRASMRKWVLLLAEAAADVELNCRAWLRDNPDDGSGTREERRVWNGFRGRRPSGGVQ